MILTGKLKGKIAEKGYTQVEISKRLGISTKTFRKRMKTGIFQSDELDILAEILGITDVCEIFFIPEVSQQATKPE
ncbi:MAG: hypothetical protein LBT51_01550 [Fusobacteriaceae bacterium]|jgi:transcriptional regulator with XRE-family HTH domain|nr:hypothetical protein [Fusobacteriaceae bacterium]